MTALRRRPSLIPEAAENRIRGLGLQEVLRYAEADAGLDLYDLLAEREPAMLEALRHGAITGGGWYPVAWLRQVYAVLMDATGRGPELAREIGYRGIYRDLSTGPFRVIGKLTSPEALFKRAPWVFSRYFEHGCMRVEVRGPGEVEVEFEACHGFDAVIWQDLIGGCEGALAAIGGTPHAVRVRVRAGGHDGDSHCRLVGSWTA